MIYKKKTQFINPKRRKRNLLFKICIFGGLSWTAVLLITNNNSDNKETLQQLAQKKVQGQQKLEENVKNDVNRGDNDIIEDKVNVIKDEDEVRQEDSNYDSSSQT